MLKVGIVGMGVIGHRIAEAITRGIPGTALAGVTCGGRRARPATPRCRSTS